MFLEKYLCLYLQFCIWILKTFSVFVKKIFFLHFFQKKQLKKKK